MRKFFGCERLGSVKLLVEDEHIIISTEQKANGMSSYAKCTPQARQRPYVTKNTEIPNRRTLLNQSETARYNEDIACCIHSFRQTFPSSGCSSYKYLRSSLVTY